MVWVKLDDQFFRNPKARAVGKDGRELFLAGLCYSAGALTDGFIGHYAVAPVLADAQVGKAAIKKLTDAGMWREVEGGYEIHDYRHYQRAAADVRKERDEGKERAARSRERRANESRAFVDGSPDLAHSPCLSEVKSLQAHSSVTREAEGRSETNHKAAELVQRMVACCKGRGPKVKADAIAVVAHCLAHVDWRLVDEAIGWAEQANQPPTMPAYFLKAVRNKAADVGILLPLAEGEKAAS